MIILAGINHKSAPVKVRGQFAFNEDDIINFSKLFEKDKKFKGLIILSTCNRTEVYVDYCCSSEEYIKETLLNNLKQYSNYKGDIDKITYTLSNRCLIKHLFKVASGLDSMVLGEYQIVGQLKDAYRISTKHYLKSNCLIRLFQKAFETSKKVRNQTKIDEGAVTVSYAAVEAAFRQFPDLCNRNILSIGAGETGQLVLGYLLKKSCKSITVTNRTHEKALKVAEKYGVKTIHLNDLKEKISDYDVVLVSTGSKKALITKEMIEKSMKKRNSGPISLIDLSVPSNIDTDTAEIKNVNLCNVDDLQSFVNNTYEKREAKIKQAETIIEEQVEDFTRWLSTRALVPTFSKISENLKQINGNEIEGFQKNKVKIDYTKAVEYGNHITDKFTRLFIEKIKAVTDNGKKEEYIKMVNELFEF